MVEAYILFALLTTDTPRHATWTAEFSTKERCVEAGQALQGLGKARLHGTDTILNQIRFVCARR